MLVVKHGYRVPALAEHIGDFQEHLETGIKRLPFIVDGIFAVLANKDHSIDRKLVAAERERFLHGPEDRHSIFLRHGAAYVATRPMLSKPGDHFRAWIGRSVVLV